MAKRGGNSLRKLVRERDQQHNTPRQMAATERGGERRRICLKCRRTLEDAFALRRARHESHKEEWSYVETRTGIGPRCPLCGGEFVEIEW